MASSNIHPQRVFFAILVLKEPKGVAKPLNPASQKIRIASSLASREVKDDLSDQAVAAVVFRKPLATVTIPSPEDGDVAPTLVLTGGTALAVLRRHGQRKRNNI